MAHLPLLSSYAPSLLPSIDQKIFFSTIERNIALTLVWGWYWKAEDTLRLFFRFYFHRTFGRNIQRDARRKNKNVRYIFLWIWLPTSKVMSHEIAFKWVMKVKLWLAFIWALGFLEEIKNLIKTWACFRFQCVLIIFWKVLICKIF